MSKVSTNLSDQLTKDFAKLVKTFVKQLGNGRRASLAYVIGYLDAATKNTSAIPESHILDYTRGWNAGMAEAKAPRRRKPRGTGL